MINTVSKDVLDITLIFCSAFKVYLITFVSDITLVYYC